MIHNIKSLLIYAAAGLTFLIIGTLSLICMIIVPSKISKIIVPFCKLMIFIFGCRIEVHGSVPEDRNFVIMANHSSFLDVFAIPSIFPKTKKFSAIAAAKNFKIPVYSIFLKRMRVISIDRSDRDQAIKGVNQAANILKDAYDVVILPEGTRTTTGELGVFKKGGFHLAYNTKTEILPIITTGLYKIKPCNRFSIKPGLIKIYIEKPINTQDKNIDTILKETEEVFKKHYN